MDKTDQHSKGKNKIHKLYDNLSYLDNYSGSVLSFIFISIVIFLACSYCYIKISAQPIINDWPNQRCKPYVIPFSGMLYKSDPNQTTEEATKQNFDYCVQNVVKDTTAYAVEPITFITSSLQSVYKDIDEGINDVRGMFNKSRTYLQSVTEEVMGRLINITIPIQQMIIAFRDMMGKVQGTMTAGLFTLLGSYYALQALFGAIAELIIILLIAMAALIVTMWIIPFTWSIASTMTATFIAISVPLALIIAFMSEHLHVNPSKSIPPVPKRPTCFDGDTFMRMKDGSLKKIKDVKVGDWLYGEVNGKITAKIRTLTKGSRMYRLKKPNTKALNNDMDNIHKREVLVSDSHLVLWNGKFIPVSSHPWAVPLEYKYEEPVLYCLNTTEKRIELGGFLFTDWDDITTNEQFYTMMRKIKTKKQEYHKKSEIHKYTDSGFYGSTLIPLSDGHYKKIKDIQPGEILLNNIQVYGVVEINIKDIAAIYQYEIIDKEDKTKFIGGPNFHIYLKNETDSVKEEKRIKTILNIPYLMDEKLDENITMEEMKKCSECPIKIKKIIQENNDDDRKNEVKKSMSFYHLLTIPNYFYLDEFEKIKILDYNSCIDYL